MSRLDLIKKLAVPSDAKVLRQINFKELKKNNPPPEDKSQLREYYSKLNENTGQGPIFNKSIIDRINSYRVELTEDQLLFVTDMKNTNKTSFKLLDDLLQRRLPGPIFIDWVIEHQDEFGDMTRDDREYASIEHNEFGEIYDAFSADMNVAQEILKLNPHKAYGAATVWHEDQIDDYDSYEGEVEHEAETIKEYDGMRLVKLTTAEELNEEGKMMGHCVGSYFEDVETGGLEIYSLRDSRGPHVTFELKESKIYQIKGKRNSPPVKKYLPAVRQVIIDMKWNPICGDFGGIEWGQTDEETKYIKPIIEKIVNENDYSFFDYKLQKKYPELEREMAKEMANNGNSSFFGYELQKRYPELGRKCAEKMADSGDSSFFGFELQKRYPKLERKCAEKIVNENDYSFFDYELQKRYPELGREMAKEMANSGDSSFFDYELQKRYPELERKCAEKMADNGDPNFPHQKLDKKFPELVPTYEQNKKASRLDLIKKLAGVLEPPPKIWEQIKQFTESAFAYHVKEISPELDFIPDVEPPDPVIRLIHESGGSGMEIPIDLEGWKYFEDIPKDELLDKIFEPVDMDPYLDFETGTVKVIFHPSLEGQDKGGLYDQDNKIIYIYNHPKQFKPKNLKEYEYYLNLSLHTAKHEAVHLAQNIFDKIKGFGERFVGDKSYQGAAGIGKRKLYKVEEKHTPLDPKEFDAFVTGVIELFKGERKLHPDNNFRKFWEYFIIFRMPEGGKKIQIYNPKLWKVLLKKLYEGVSYLDNEDRSDNKIKSWLDIMNRDKINNREEKISFLVDVLKKESAHLGRKERIKRLAKKHSYKEKRKEESGNITYVYDEKHVKERTRKKSNQVEKLRKSIPKVRAQIKKDLSSDDEKTKYTALAAALIDETYERVGNKQSAEENKHYGVTRWLVKHVSFSGSTAKIKYVGKSGVNQEKSVSDSKVVSVLKEACKGKSKSDRVFEEDDFMVNRKTVNAYLKEFDITTKDIRGFHANDEMITQLKKARKGSLPKDAKEKEDKLKEEFKEALEETAKVVGHEASTLKNQYLVPSLETSFMNGGKIISSLNKAARLYLIESIANMEDELEPDELEEGSIVEKHWGINEPENQDEEYKDKYQVTLIRKLQPAFQLKNTKIKNSVFEEQGTNTEPVGGLWTSTLKKGSTEWLNFRKNEGMGGAKRGAIFSIDPSAKIYHINSKEDYDKLQMQFPRTAKNYVEKYLVEGRLDWEKVATVYDGIHLSNPNKLCKAYSDDYVDELSSWDVESTLWLNTSKLKIEEISPVRNWKLKTVTNLDVNDRLIRLGNKLEDLGFNKYAKKIDKLIDCPFGNCNVKQAEEFRRYVIQGKEEAGDFVYGPFMTREEAMVWGWWTWAGESAEEQFRIITYGEEWEYFMEQQDPKTREHGSESDKLLPINKLPLWQSYFIKEYAKNGRLSFGQLKSAINELLSGDYDRRHLSRSPGLNMALGVLQILREKGLAKQRGEE